MSNFKNKYVQKVNSLSISYKKLKKKNERSNNFVNCLPKSLSLDLQWTTKAVVGWEFLMVTCHDVNGAILLEAA